jgi:tripartite-type tricarboxylate transporter receptor subunit TctC
MTPIDRRHALAALGSAAATLAWPRTAFADEQVPLLKILFGYPTAGVGGLVTQGVGEKLTGSYAKAVIVESKPGAAGRLILEAVKGAPADGSTVFVSPSSVLAMYPHVYKKLSYDPFSDMVPVSNLCEFVHGLAVGPAVPESVKTLGDFVAWCKAHPGQANIGNPGEGSLPHFLTLLLSQSTGFKFESIAYGGGPPGVKDTMGGQLTAMMATEGQFITFLPEGKLRLLATSGAQRSPFSPNVPTFTEQGMKGMQVSEWIGMFAPSRTPSSITARIAAAVHTALASPGLAANFAKYAIQPAPSTPEELGRRLRADFDFWGPTVKATGFSPLS